MYLLVSCRLSVLVSPPTSSTTRHTPLLVIYYDELCFLLSSLATSCGPADTLLPLFVYNSLIDRKESRGRGERGHRGRKELKKKAFYYQTET